MKETNDKTHRIETAAEDVRRRFEQAEQKMRRSEKLANVKAAAGRAIRAARGWSARRLPGGEVTMWVVVGLVCLALFIWAILPGNNNGLFGDGPQAEAQSIGIAVAQKGDMAVTLSALGTVTPLATATVTPQVSGQVMRVEFHEGQMVKAGDELALIDPRTYQAALDKAKGTLAQDRASLANAQVEEKRQRALYAAKATSQQDLDSAVASAKQYAGAVEADKASVASAAIQLGFTRVVSPISGRVGLRGVDVGNYVSSGQSTGIAVVTQMDPMSVLFAVPEDSVSEIISRMHAGEEILVDAYDRSMSRKIASGDLVATDSEIDTSTGTLKMRALFPNDDNALFPNQFVNVKILVKTLHNQTIVPVTAILRGSQGTYVFVVRPDKTVSMRTVTLGAQDSDRIVVVKGLNPGETVVTDGADRLSDGSPVLVPEGRQIEKVQAAADARPVEVDRRQLFRKMTPEEHKAFHDMSPEARKAWLETHKEELAKRKNQPRPRGPRGPGPGGPPPPH